MDELHERMRSSAVRLGHEVRDWKDEWLGAWPAMPDRQVIFHGSLNVAAQIAVTSPWQPGAFCNAADFACSSWYPRAAQRLAHDSWVGTTVRNFTESPAGAFAELGNPDRVFVRPDSSLKPFSGRVLEAGSVSPAALDYGFYYEDLDLPIIVAPPREIGREWRFVVVGRNVVVGSQYEADGRESVVGVTVGAPLELAQQIAASMEIADPIYVLDVAEIEGELRLLELGPFSGCDLYACDTDLIVAAVAELLGG